MKKFFLLLAGSAMLFSSCESSQPTTDEAWQQYYYGVGTVLFMSVSSQIEYNLDPFEIAFRLNTLMTETLLEAEKNGDPNPVITAEAMNNCSAKSKLFGNATIVDKGNNIYGIDNIGSMNSNNKILRSGNIEIRTGNGSPMTVGNTWYVFLNEDNPYTISMDGTLISIKASSYQISSTKENEWQVSLGEYVAKINSEGETQYNSEGSNWSGIMTITQVNNPGDQSINGITNSSYKLDISQTIGVTPSMIAEKVTVNTPSPIVIYSPQCGQTITEGSLVIRLSESEDLLDFTSVTWTPNTSADTDNDSDTNNGNKCTSSIKMTCHGYDIPISSSSN